MAKVTIKAKQEDVEKAGEDQGEFEVPKPGFYHVKIVEANPGFSKKKGEDEEDPTKPRVEVVYEIVGEGMEAAEPKANYGRLWDYVTFGDGYAGTRRAEFAMALDPSLTKDDIKKGVDFDTDEMIERILIARIKHEKDKRKSEEEKKVVMRARIATIMPLDNADGYTAAEFEGDAYADAEDDGEGNEEPFGGEVEPDVEEEEAPESDLLTEEELDGYDLKELGATAKEFDLNPEDSLVKFKSGDKKGKVNQAATKKAIIEAILEAQGGDEDDEDDGDADGDEENPF